MKYVYVCTCEFREFCLFVYSLGLLLLVWSVGNATRSFGDSHQGSPPSSSFQHPTVS